MPTRTRTSTRLAGPSTLAAHASSAGSTLARTWVASVGHPAAGAAGSASTSSRWVTAVPERGVRTTSTSGGCGVAARERVDRRARALRVALHDLVDALGDEQVGERVDGVVERAQLGVDRLALRAGERAGRPALAERDRRVVPARRRRRPRASGGAARARRRRCSPAAPPTRAARVRAARPAGRGAAATAASRRLDLRQLVGDLLVERGHLRRRPSAAGRAARLRRAAGAGDRVVGRGRDLRLEAARSAASAACDVGRARSGSPGSRRAGARCRNCRSVRARLQSRAQRGRRSPAPRRAAAGAAAICAAQRGVGRLRPRRSAGAAGRAPGAAAACAVARHAEVVLGGGDRVQRRERAQRRDVAVEDELADGARAGRAPAGSRAARRAAGRRGRRRAGRARAGRARDERSSASGVAGTADVREVPGAQDGGGRRLPERRGVDVAVARRLRGRRRAARPRARRSRRAARRARACARSAVSRRVACALTQASRRCEARSSTPPASRAEHRGRQRDELAQRAVQLEQLGELGGRRRARGAVGRAHARRGARPSVCPAAVTPSSGAREPRPRASARACRRQPGLVALARRRERRGRGGCAAAAVAYARSSAWRSSANSSVFAPAGGVPVRNASSPMWTSQVM